MKKRIIISIWADPSNYINLLSLINFFIKNHFQVFLICQYIERKKDFYYFVKKNKNLKIVEINKKGKIGYLNFFKVKFNIMKKFNPQTLLSVNFISLFISFFLNNKNLKWIYYNFDFNLTKEFNLNNYLEKKIIASVDTIFIPSNSRLKIYKKNFLREENIFSLHNCFSKNFKIKNYAVNKINKKLRKKKYLIRLGSFFNYHCLKELALSTKYWNGNTCLVMAGKSYDGYFNELKKFKNKNNLNKVILIENISYEHWFSLLKNSIAGFALYEPINTSHLMMGGTSQKLNNYIFSGIPSFISKNKDFIKFNKKYQTSIEVNNSIQDIAKEVNLFLKNKKLIKKLEKKNKDAFKGEFNFEKQFNNLKKFFI